MNGMLTKRILDLIRSEGLKAKLRETGFWPTDRELLSLAFDCAPDFDTRIELLRELENEFTGEYREYIKRLIAEQKAALEEFKKPSPDVVFELHIKEDPDSYDERYLCGSYEAALKTIALFWQEYECAEKELTHYRIVKRKVYRGGEDEPFAEDELGEMDLLPGCVIYSVDIWANDRSAEGCDGCCFECSRPCARNHDISFPCFIRHGDPVKWTDHSGRVSFGIALFGGDEPCEEYYVIPLDSERILLHDFKNMHYDHEHILAPLAERITADELPERMRADYFACREFLKTDDSYGPKLSEEE